MSFSLKLDQSPDNSGTHAANTYQYTSLRGPRPIRLLELYPNTGSPDSPIQCFIHHASLDESNFQYKALSYAWGNEEPTATVYVNSQQFRVRPNLEAALRRLRAGQLSWANLSFMNLAHKFKKETFCSELITTSCLHPTYLLWIDAICINQEDATEKTQQVAQMRYIYKNAAEVIVWLGEDLGDTLPALQLLAGLADIYDMSAADAPGFISHVVRDETCKNAWIALGNLLHRPWWRRAWILQEVLLARKALALCGRWCIPWDELVKASTCFRLCSNYIDEIREATVGIPTFEYFSGFATGQRHLRVYTILKIFMSRMNNSLGLREESEWLETLLPLSKNYLASDAEDKVYSLLGILEEVGCHCLQVDYTSSVCDLYMETARILYESSKSLNFLSMVERSRDTNREQNFGLPSWAPDWTIPTNMDPILGNGSISQRREVNPFVLTEVKVTFTKDSEALCTFDFPRKTLKLVGFVVDQIHTTAERYKDLIPDFSAQGIQRFGRRIGWKPPDAVEQAKWSSFGSDKLPQMYSSLAGRTPLLNELGHTIGPDDNVRGTSDVTSPKVTFTCFRTKGFGYTGVTDSAIEQGDSICALLGSKVPHLLRMQDDVWIRVGQCSLNGKMHGEVMDDLACGKYKLQEFTLR